MKKIKITLRIITACLALILIGLVVYFSFIKDSTKIIFNEALKVDKDYKWVLTNMSEEIKDDNNNYYDNKDVIAAEEIKLNKEESLIYQNSFVLKYPFYTKDKCLYVTFALSNEHNIDVALISSNTNAYKYNIRSVGDMTNKKICYSDLAKGKYHIYVVDNGDIYDTTQYIVVE